MVACFSPPLALAADQRRARMVSSRHRQVKATAATPSPSARPTWQCIPSCGACCKIGDYDAEVLDEMLKKPEEVAQYVSMVGEDGWCRHFDSTSRTCSIYDTRPRFCRVSPETFKEMYDVEPEELDDFSIDCCVYHISLVFGEESGEIQRFERAVGIMVGKDSDYDDDDDDDEGDFDVIETDLARA